MAGDFDMETVAVAGAYADASIRAAPRNIVRAFLEQKKIVVESLIREACIVVE